MYDDRQVYRELDEITAENSLYVDVITLCLFPGSSHSVGAGQNGARLSIQKEGTCTGTHYLFIKIHASYTVILMMI